VPGCAELVIAERLGKSHADDPVALHPDAHDEAELTVPVLHSQRWIGSDGRLPGHLL